MFVMKLCFPAQNKCALPWPPRGFGPSLALISYSLRLDQVEFHFIYLPKILIRFGLIKCCSGLGGITHNPHRFHLDTFLDPAYAAVWKSCKRKENTEGGREKWGWNICTVFYQRGIDDLPKDFLIDVVELEETLLLTCGYGQWWEGWETVREGIKRVKFIQEWMEEM